MENKTELTKEQLNGVSGAGGTRKDKDTDMVRCPSCGAANEVPAKDCITVTCTSCGRQFQT